MTLTAIELALQMARTFDRLGIDYALGGSIASSIVGEPRATVDIDMAVRLAVDDIERLIAEVGPEFYVPVESARAAAREFESFNLVHNDVALKVDLFVLGDNPLDQGQITRRVSFQLGAEPSDQIWVTAPEDQVLRKLQWFQSGGEISERQWRDVVAILRINADDLDNDYLNDAAALVGLADLLNDARNAV